MEREMLQSPTTETRRLRVKFFLSAALTLCGLYLLCGTTQSPVLAQTPTIAPMHVHHVHLNSVDPAKAAAYYPKPFARRRQGRRSTVMRR